MAIEFVAEAGARKSITYPGNYNIAVSVPSGTANGHIMVAFISYFGAEFTPALPAGWNNIRAVEPNAIRSRAVWRLASSEPSSYTFAATGNVSGTMVASILTYSGVDTTSPIDDHNGWPQAYPNTWNAPSVTTTVPDARLLVMAYSTFGTTWVAPSGMTKRVDQPYSSFIGSMMVADETVASVGETGVRVMTSPGTGGIHQSMTVALKPAGGGDPDPLPPRRRRSSYLYL